MGRDAQEIPGGGGRKKLFRTHPLIIKIEQPLYLTDVVIFSPQLKTILLFQLLFYSTLSELLIILHSFPFFVKSLCDFHSQICCGEMLLIFIQSETLNIGKGSECNLPCAISTSKWKMFNSEKIAVRTSCLCSALQGTRLIVLFRACRTSLMWTSEGWAKSVHNSELFTLVSTFYVVQTINGPGNQCPHTVSIHIGGVCTRRTSTVCLRPSI